MKHKLFLFSGILLFILTLNTCYYDSKEYLYPEIGAACDTTNVTYSVSVKKILTENCLSCHSNAASASFGGDIKLENYTDVVSIVQNNRLMGALKHESGFVPMPKNGGMLSDCKIITLQKWIDANTPNN